MFSLDFNGEVADLKTSLNCVKCHDLAKDIHIISTCDHILCEKCVGKTNFVCPKCHGNFASRDIQKSDVFIQKSLSFIKKMDERFNSNYSFDNIPFNFKQELIMKMKDVKLKVCKKNNSDLEKKSSESVNEITSMGDGSENTLKISNIASKRKIAAKDLEKAAIKNKTAGSTKTRARNKNISSANTKKPIKPTVDNKTPIPQVIITKLPMSNDTHNATTTSATKTSSQIAAESKNKTLEAMIGVLPEYNDKDIFQCKEIGDNYIKIIQSVMKKNPKGETPLHIACKRGNIETVQTLISCGVDLNAVDFANFTPLHEATQSNSITCIELLLLNGALPNIPAQNYRTPLHEAVDSELGIIVELLLTYGADKTAVDCFGKTPLDLCKSDEIRKILQNTERNESVPKLLYSGEKRFHSFGVSGFHIDILHTFRWTYCKTLDDNVQLLTIGFDVSSYHPKVLEGILKGVMIIRDNFIYEYTYVNRPIYPEFISEDIRQPVLASIKNNLNKLPKLFDGMKFHVLNHSKGFKINDIPYKKEDLINLIKTGGGKILQRAPAERTAENDTFWPYHTKGCEKLRCCSDYIVYEIGNPPLLMYNMTELRHVSSEWLVGCVLKFKVDF